MCSFKKVLEFKFSECLIALKSGLPLTTYLSYERRVNFLYHNHRDSGSDIDYQPSVLNNLYDLGSYRSAVEVTPLEFAILEYGYAQVDISHLDCYSGDRLAALKAYQRLLLWLISKGVL